MKDKRTQSAELRAQREFAPSGVTSILVCGSLILLLSFGVRASFGLFQLPIAREFGWPRADYSLAIAIQNLAWGFGQPVFAAIGERFGDRRAIVLGVFAYAAGLIFSAISVTPIEHQIWNVLIGCGIAGTGFGVILGIVGRAAPDKHRSAVLGIATAAGSAGQVIGPPAAAYLLGLMSWPSVFVVFACVILSSLAALPMMNTPGTFARQGTEDAILAVLRRTLCDPNYLMIFVGFFSCGYQLGFITAHFPAFVTEICGPISPTSLLAQIGVNQTSQLGAYAMGLIGLANILGTLLAGKLGDRYPKKFLLASIYTGRTIAAAWLILTPVTPTTVIIFSLVMGAMWLATVPLTSGLVAHIYGLRYMGTLYGVVFFSHQLGSFLGVWLGGMFYDLYGSYQVVWWVGVGVGAFSAVIHLPVRERPRALMPA